jgi:hypothetical protein
MVCVVWHLSGAALDPSRITHTIHQVRENWDELRHPNTGFPLNVSRSRDEPGQTLRNVAAVEPGK